MILAVIRMWFLALPCRGPADPNSGLNTRAFTVLAPEAFFGQIFTLWGVFEAWGGEWRDCTVGGWSGWYYWWRPYNYNALVAKGWPPIKATDLAGALKGCIRHGSGFDPDHVSMQWLAISWSSFQVFFLAFRYFSSLAVTLCSFKFLNNIGNFIEKTSSHFAGSPRFWFMFKIPPLGQPRSHPRANLTLFSPWREEAHRSLFLSI